MDELPCEVSIVEQRRPLIFHGVDRANNAIYQTTRKVADTLLMKFFSSFVVPDDSDIGQS